MGRSAIQVECSELTSQLFWGSYAEHIAINIRWRNPFGIGRLADFDVGLLDGKLPPDMLKLLQRRANADLRARLTGLLPAGASNFKAPPLLGDDELLSLADLVELLLQDQIQDAQAGHPASPPPATQPSAIPATQPIGAATDYATLIEKHKGRQHQVYPDNKGNPTIGVGFNLNRADTDATLGKILPGVTRSDLLNGRQIDDTQIDALLANDIQTALAAAKRELSDFDTLAPDARWAVVDMIFNLGAGGFSQFKKLRAALERHDYAGAAREMQNSRWYGQVGNRGRDDVELMNDASSNQ